MLAELRRKLSSVSPRVAIGVGLLIAFVAGSAVALLFMRGADKAGADDSVQPMAARIDRVDGSVGIARVVDENTEPDWDEATLNAPVSVGDRVYSREGSRASIALTGHNFVRMEPDTSLDVLALGDQRTQLALRGGSALFDVGALEPDEFYEVATPYGAVDFTEPGLYQIGIDDGSAIISVLSGLAQVVGQGGSGYINKGQVFTLASAAATEVLASKLSPSLAGGIVDDYYRYRHPTVYDGRYANYDTYLEDPFYYDPYRSSASCRYVAADIPGLYDLDGYGDWSNLDGYGNSWAPRVASGWAPFRSGSWDLYDAWGPTWVSTEPWGWAPYHYGRWAYVQERWFWVPVEVRTGRSYSPAPVAFISLSSSNQIGWVPLGPGERYVPRYYDANFRPRYLASREVIREVTVQQTFVNLNAPSGVTVVPVQGFRRHIDPSNIAQVDPKLFAKSQQALDPFAVKGVRELALRNRENRGSMKLARSEQEAFNRPVVTSRAPTPLPSETNLAKAFRVESVSGEQKKKKLKVDDTSQVIADRRPNGLPEANAPNQIRTGKDREQRGGGQPAAINPPGGQPQQRAQQEQLRQQMREQVKAERQQQRGVAPQADAARQAQQQQMREQKKEQKRLERKPPEPSVQQQQQRVQQQQQRAHQQQQQQQQSVQQQQQRVQQQQQQRVQQQQQKQDQQPKQQKRKPPEASVQQQQRTNQAAQMREQARTQRAPDTGRQQTQARQQQQQRSMVDQQNRMAAARAGQQARESQARAQLPQQQMMRQQAARAQAAQQQQIRRQEPRPQLQGPPTQQPSPPQAQQQSERGGKRKPPK
ncbi:MAG: FecR family protein [Acidobacteriota bacterium]